MSLFNVTRKELLWGGRKLVLETGKVARQADGAVMATYGETTVLCTVVGAKSAKPGQDFFPLTVNYQEKAFAAGKIPGGFFKREGRPSEAETLISRLIDRPIRPLFVEGYRNETQVICTVLSHDMENSPDVVAMIGASAALTISGLPFLGPIAGARVGYKDGQYLLNPTIAEIAESDLDLVVAGTREGVLMVESQADQLSEEVMLGAVTFGHEAFQAVIDMIIALAETSAKEPRDVPPPAAAVAVTKAKFDANGIREKFAAAYGIKAKLERQDAVKAVRVEATALLDETTVDAASAKDIFETMEADVVRSAILDTGVRIDGRTGTQIRPIEAEVGVCRALTVPPVHRGETQALVVTTSAPARTNRSSMRWKANTAATSCCTTTSRRTRWARRGAWAPRVVAKSATASSPGAR
jgi:polyribonucleotide nucleotidyltransferase